MNLDCIFKPKSIAIIGASTKLNSVGNDIVKNLVTQGFTGKIYPINPKTESLYNLPCYKNIKEIKGTIDLAVVVVPADLVPTVAQEAAEKGVKGMVVISAGFKEVGRIDLEKQLAKICSDNNIALIGPNCLGVINPDIKMNASFSTQIPNSGSVAFVSQSGALCAGVLDYAKKLNIGFSKFISVGNKALVDELELLKYLANDPQTKVIAMYVEQLNKSEEIINIVKKITRGKNPKPVIMIKAGRTSAGASASASHTGALAGNDAAYEALFKQSGIIRATWVSELFEYVQAFDNNSLPKGKNVAIITNAGGPGVLCTDEVISQGLQLAKFSSTTIEKLKKYLPPAANTSNPIDVLGDAKADRYEQALQIAIADSGVDSILILLTPQSMTEIDETAHVIVDARRHTNKPIMVSFMGEDSVKNGVEIMQQAGVGTANFPEQTARALAALTNFSNWSKLPTDKNFKLNNIDKKKVTKILTAAKQSSQTNFSEAPALEILEAYGFSMLKRKLVTTSKEAENFAKEIGKLVVMKISSPDILHKSDVGGVILNINSQTAANEFEKLITHIKTARPNAHINGILIEEMQTDRGAEMILGSKTDVTLGQMIMVGLGGIYVEVFKDVSFGLAPLNKTSATHMIESLKSKKILDGARSGNKLDSDALIESLGRLSQLLTDFPEIKELDINPLRVLEKGAKVLDARIIIG